MIRKTISAALIATFAGLSFAALAPASASAETVVIIKPRRHYERVYVAPRRVYVQPRVYLAPRRVYVEPACYNRTTKTYYRNKIVIKKTRVCP